MNAAVRIGDILKNPYFQNAEIIASPKALERMVKWVHIMEVAKVGQLLNGNELILSTGIGWQNEQETSVIFLQQLIEHDAAGLCIELGTYTKHPSEQMKQLALQSDFPLILFHEEVRYIDITRDLHTFFINRHHQMISSLDSLTSQFNRLLLAGKGITPIIKLLQEKTKRQIGFLPSKGKPLFYPSLPAKLQDVKLRAWQRHEQETAKKSKRIASRPVVVMNQTFANLIIEADTELSEFDILALDRCATALAQELMRTMYVEERKRYRENVWIQEWLEGTLKEPEIREYLESLKPGIKPRWLTACVFELDRKTIHSPEFESVMIQRLIAARSIFETYGFLLIPTIIHHQFVFILISIHHTDRIVTHLAKPLGKLHRLDKQGGPAFFSGLTGVGMAVQELEQLAKSFEAACETIDIQKTTGPLPNPFYTELHMYRLLSIIEKSGHLPSFIEDYLGPLLKYDHEKNAQLLKTLKVYLQLSGAKQETANSLFIVRQTLYHRLDKIKELLGDDFMNPEKRLMIELALYAYEYHYEIIK